MLDRVLNIGHLKAAVLVSLLMHLKKYLHRGTEKYFPVDYYVKSKYLIKVNNKDTETASMDVNSGFLSLTWSRYIHCLATNYLKRCKIG